MHFEQLRLDSRGPGQDDGVTQKRRRSVTATPRRPAKTSPGTDQTTPNTKQCQTPQSQMKIFKKKYVDSLSDTQLSNLEKFKMAAQAWAQQPEVLERKELKETRRRQSEHEKLKRAQYGSQRTEGEFTKKKQRTSIRTRRAKENQDRDKAKTADKAKDDDATVTAGTLSLEPDSDSEDAF